MKENFTVTTFLFLFEFSLRREEIRVSGVVGVVSGMRLLLLISPSSWMFDWWLSRQNERFLCVVVHNLGAVHLVDEYTT